MQVNNVISGRECGTLMRRNKSFSSFARNILQNRVFTFDPSMNLLRKLIYENVRPRSPTFSFLPLSI